MELILKALREAQAVLAEHITPKAPVAPSDSITHYRLMAEANEKVINDLLGILDNRELVKQQRACEKINGNNQFTAAISTLEYLGYTYSPGAEKWKPPVGPVPNSWHDNKAPAVDPNVEAVRKMLLERSAVGFKKYGCTTATANLELADWLQHMQEELCDAAVYIQAAKSGASPFATELKEARKEREAALELLQNAAAENTELRATLARVTVALKGNQF